MFSIEYKSARLPAGDYIRDYRDEGRFISYCRECHNYGTVWMCPPFGFNPSTRIENHRYIYILGAKVHLNDALRHSPTDADSLKEISYRIMHEARESIDARLLDLEKLYPGSLAFFAGNCHLCRREDCTRTSGNECLHPDKARSSLEAYGFDIAKTTSELLGIEMKWSENLILPEYLTLVSGLFSNHDININSIRPLL